MRINIREEESSLMQVYVNDFSDNYHRLSNEPSSELEKAARKIRRRYKDLNEYMKALSIYNEYMALLALKHGGPELFKLKLKNDAIHDFVPPRPQMKNNAFNKEILKRKILVSRINTNNIDEEKVEELEKVMDYDNNEDALYIDTTTKDKTAAKIIKEEQFTIDRKKVREITNIEYLEEYFRNKNNVQKKKEQENLYSLSDIVSGKALEKVKDTSEEDDVVFFRGNFINRESMNELQVYQQFANIGWNPLKIMKDKNVSKKITKVMKNQNKKNKNKKGKKNKKMENDPFLVQIFTDGGYDSFGEFEKEMLNMTSENVFKD